ncbi:cupin [Rhizobium sp. RMa-01]|uniref:cupin domain-containing protein n=1 Tax=Rhizobium sp. RSm-3 TaxID=1720346 RepID=UPI0006736BDF|nr:cupin domain-containing protein [Rhizobium sp. RSm-3]OHV27005.1 cupin [Rhizobium sp. RSm-3]RVU12164.1 cupin [Rhizobium sp. RMa-01]
MASETSSGRVPVHIRRVVTEHGNKGAASFAEDGAVPRTDIFRTVPGLVSRMIWSTSASTAVPFNGTDPTSQVTSFVPEPGETRFLVLTFPPDAVFMSPDFDGPAAMAENLAVSPGLAERFEPDGKHQTPTVDYGIVLDGEIWMELDDGNETRLGQFDAFVQNGTCHAWRNKSDGPATIAVVLVGARTADTTD